MTAPDAWADLCDEMLDRFAVRQARLREIGEFFDRVPDAPAAHYFRLSDEAREIEMVLAAVSRYASGDTAIVEHYAGDDDAS